MDQPKSSVLTTFIIQLKNALSFDLRSLAFARISLGISLIYYFFTLFQDFRLFLTSEGLVPRKEYIGTMAHAWSWSVYFINDHPNFIFLLLCFHFALVLSFTLGYKTKLSTFLLWIMTVSLHNRNWFILNGGDDLIRCMLLICIFLPLGKCFSIDAVTHRLPSGKKQSPTIKNYFSWFNLCFIYQLGSIYVVSALFKYHPIWRSEFTALDYALHLDMFARPFGIWMRDQYHLLKWMTASAIIIEVYAPFLLALGLISKLFSTSRYMAVIIFSSFHLGIDLLINVGPFPYYAISFWLALLPADFWVQNRKFVYFLKRTLQFLISKSYTAQLKIIQAFRTLSSLSMIPALVIFPLLLYWPLMDLKTEKLIDYAWVNYNEVVLNSSRWLHTYQNWKLFAPFPKNNNVWFQILGELNNGKQINLHLKNDQVSENYPNPEEINEQFYTENIRKLFLSLENTEKNRELMANYYCRLWNEQHKGFEPGILKSVEIKFYGQRNLASGKTGPQEKSVLLKHVCTSP
ncbi:MAG: hypothetical protein QE271_08855 [Bacteriovoracaceae bacterium]|nr:hypothetical protein [Bacteriovoracaceae bacterium]